MNQRSVQRLRDGIYRLWWKDGGSSLAAVGITTDGKRWFAPTNWVRPDSNGAHWRDVRRAELVMYLPPHP